MRYFVTLCILLLAGFGCAGGEKSGDETLPGNDSMSSGSGIGDAGQGSGSQGTGGQDEAGGSVPGQAAVQKAGSKKGSAQVTRFTRVREPRENAFTVLIPAGWQTEGGIFRVDPTAAGGPSQSIAAKCDFAVKSDGAGSVMVRWLPDVLFYDPSYSPAGQMGMFPPGSNYQGMTVYRVMPAPQFIRDIAFPYAHPQASGLQVKEAKSLPELAQKYRQYASAIVPGSTFSYDAALVTMTYQEGGKTYEEKMVTVVENWGQLGAGMWGNKETYYIRAPKGELGKWAPHLSTIQNSVVLNSQWIAGEIRGQAQRGEIALNTQREVERIGREITEHRQKTNAEINNDMFLTLTGQEEYVNPYTKEVETGSNQWKYRWVNESGEVLYTDTEEYDPNVDVDLNRSDYKRTPVRKRFGE